ncbi:MAG TPA: hypothetical protein VG673_20100 [Actinomycetota bacterium]|nr:hypothetical protein [Actinomycetota bacterium]
MGDVGRRPAGQLLPARQDVVGGLQAEAGGGVTAQRPQVDAGTG